jgi:gluconokinase
MTRERVVVDTNVLISALLFRTSKSSLALEHITSESDLIASRQTLDELSSTLLRDKFERYLPKTDRLVLLNRLLPLFDLVEVLERVQQSRDPKDDKFLEVALNGSAGLIITGDEDLLVLDPFRSVRIVTPSDYLLRAKTHATVVVLMGTTGSGKTTVGQLLARELSWEFADADDFHSAANKEKMSKGVGLTDEDRTPWLESLRVRINEWIERGENAVLACSALKQAYRDTLSVGAEVKWVYLKGSYDEISARLAARTGHYAKADLLASQFAVLEEPKDALAVSVEQTPEAIAGEIRGRLGL